MTMPQDDAALAARADEWLRAGLACQPADREAARRAVHRAYAAAGLPAPEHVVWLGSPAAGAVAVALLSAGDEDREPQGTPTAGSPPKSSPAPGSSPVPLPGAGSLPAAAGPQVASPTGYGAGVAAVLAALRAQGIDPAGVRLGRSVRPAVRTRPWARARAGLLAELGPIGFARHWAASAARPWRQLAELVVAALRTRLDAQFAAQGDPIGTLARAALLDAIHGQHDAAWLGAFAPVPAAGTDAAGEPHGTPAAAGITVPAGDTADGVAALAGIARAAGWWWAFEHVAVLTERPTSVHRDNLGRLHHDGGPALSYPDGFGLHAWRGMPIPPEVAVELGSLTIERIRAEGNAEIRRVMLEHFGFERYLRDSRAQKIHEDACGILWRVDLPGDEPLTMVEVVNATPEPDGTSRTYFLRVPPGIGTAKGGVAWTFGLTEEEYAPLVQT